MKNLVSSAKHVIASWRQFCALSRIIRDNLCVHRLQPACFNRSRLKTVRGSSPAWCNFPLLTFRDIRLIVSHRQGAACRAHARRVRLISAAET